MTWFSLICLLAVSSSAFGRATDYGYSAPSRDLPPTSYSAPARDLTPSYSAPARDLTPSYSAPPMRDQSYGKFNDQPSYGKFNDQPSYGKFNDQSYGKTIASRVFPSQDQLLMDQQTLLKQKIEAAEIVSDADRLCRGQRPESIISLDGGRRFVVCVDEGKGFEQVCPKDLLFHPDTRRCERKLGAFDNLCASQPCLNGGQCIQNEAHQYTCQCAAGFDGRNCELDATVCQTQQPCGSGADVKCQSFRWGAALTHVCIFQGGRAYGLNSQQTFANPCSGIDGPQPLAFGNGGYLACDGSTMYIESCPGGTGWEDSNKACVWPDMKEDQPRINGYGSYAPAREQSYAPAREQSYAPAREQSYAPARDQPKAYGAKIITPSFDQTSYAPARDQPTYNKVVMDQPSYAPARDQPTYNKVVMDQPSYAPARDQPTYNKVLLDQPAYGKQMDQPSYAPARDQPTYNKLVLDQPSYGKQMDQPSYNKIVPRQMDIRPVQSGY